MERRRVMFDRFEFPVMKGLDYLLDEEKPITDYLFINGPHGEFSMYFETGQKPFSLPEGSSLKGESCLLEMRRTNRCIHIYCPERVSGRESAMWYFYVELTDDDGRTHVLPGQIRVILHEGETRLFDEKMLLIKILEQVRLSQDSRIA